MNNFIPTSSYFLLVIQQLFGWEVSKEEPTDKEILVLLRTKFSVRVDLDRKVIEHAIAIDDEAIAALLSSSEEIDGNEKQKLQ